MASGSQRVTTYSSNTLIPKLNSSSLANFTDSQNLIYTYYDGDNSIDDKPTSVDAFGVMSFKTAAGWYGQLLMSSNNATGLYWRTATSLSGGWYKLLDSSNYTDYTVTKTGSGASGTWSISINGNAATATSIAVTAAAEDDCIPGNDRFQAFRCTSSSTGGGDGYIWAQRWNGGNYITQIYTEVDASYLMCYRFKKNADSTWGAWKRIPMGDGTGASGTWGISISGNAATATRINGNLAAATSDVNRNIWVSSTTNADGIPNYISGFCMNPSTKVFMVPGSTRISPNTGALYLGNSGNQSWVYVQDMCSQDGQKWKIHQSGSAEFNGTVTAPTFSGKATSADIAERANYLNWVATNEIRFAWESRCSSATDLYFGYAWSGGNKAGIINNYRFCNGNTALTGLYAAKVYNAVWNDFAEYRESDITEGGRVLVSDGKGRMILSTERLQPSARVISDTFGCSVGQSDTARTPIGVAGRVLVYPYQPRENYKVGDCLCAAPDGTADIMTREEIKEYPDRIIGIVDEVPEYEIWDQVLTTKKDDDETGGQNHTNIEVKGRIWIYVR